MTIKEGDKFPEFHLQADDGQAYSHLDLQGKVTVMYFYPKDNTSGCTKEACDFNDTLREFNRAKINVMGVSRDSLASHVKFKQKYKLQFPLLSDNESELSQKLGVLVEKSMYGRKYLGVDRSTFIIDEKGKIKKIWRNVKVPGHVAEVLAELK